MKIIFQYSIVIHLSYSILRFSTTVFASTPRPATFTGYRTSNTPSWKLHPLTLLPFFSSWFLKVPYKVFFSNLRLFISFLHGDKPFQTIKYSIRPGEIANLTLLWTLFHVCCKSKFCFRYAVFPCINALYLSSVQSLDPLPMHGRDLDVHPEDFMETPDQGQDSKQEILENKDVSSCQGKTC